MKIIEPNTPEEFEKYFNLRFEVLRKPWNQPFSSTKDEWEDQSIHVLMMDEKDEAIACGRLQLNSAGEGQIRSMAVAAHLQGKGLGKKIISWIEGRSLQLKLKTIILDARENAVPFYESCGYKVIGGSYLLFGIIKHYRMLKNLNQSGDH